MTDKEKTLIKIAIDLARDDWSDDFIFERLAEHERLFYTVQDNTAASFIRGLKKQYTGKE